MLPFLYIYKCVCGLATKKKERKIEKSKKEIEMDNKNTCRYCCYFFFRLNPAQKSEMMRKK